MEDDVEPALHIGGTGPIYRVVVEPAGVLERMVGRKDRVHMAGEHETPFRFRADAQDHMLAMRLFVFAPLGGNGGNLGRLHQLDLAGQGGKGIGEHACHRIQPFDIGRPGIDRSPVLHLAQHGVGIDGVEQGLRWAIRFHWQLP